MKIALLILVVAMATDVCRGQKKDKKKKMLTVDVGQLYDTTYLEEAMEHFAEISEKDKSQVCKGKKVPEFCEFLKGKEERLLQIFDNTFDTTPQPPKTSTTTSEPHDEDEDKELTSTTSQPSTLSTPTTSTPSGLPNYVCFTNTTKGPCEYETHVLKWFYVSVNSKNKKNKKNEKKGKYCFVPLPCHPDQTFTYAKCINEKCKLSKKGKKRGKKGQCVGDDFKKYNKVHVLCVEMGKKKSTRQWKQVSIQTQQTCECSKIKKRGGKN